MTAGRGYHLFARVLYRAIAKEHIRARHRHSLEHIRTRLAAPQFVLSHLQTDYLETEQEKVEFFHLNYRIEPTKLPKKVYKGRSNSSTPLCEVPAAPIRSLPGDESEGQEGSFLERINDLPSSCQLLRAI